MKLGAEPKKIAILGGLVLLAATVFYINSTGTSAPPDSGKQTAKRSLTAETIATPAPAAAAPVAAPNGPDISRAPRMARGQRTSQEFRPTLKPKRPEDRVDPMKVDPTLRLDLLAKVREIRVESTRRSLFDFAQAPPPKTKDVKVVPKPVGAEAAKLAAAAAAKPPEPVKPPPPPIPLKFYGYINPLKQGIKRVFFTEGEDIFVVSEGELIKKRYKVVKIGVNSVVVEDTQFQHQQTLPLEELPA